jgi:hypothetical protein
LLGISLPSGAEPDVTRRVVSALSTPPDIQKHEANVADGASGKILLLVPPDLYSDGTCIYPPFHSHGTLASEGLPL